MIARASLWYLASYLGLTGAAFLFAPSVALALLQAAGTYDAPFVQFVGAFMIALAVLVVQIIRLKIDTLHTTTVAIRLFFVAVILWLFAETRDPLFIVILCVVVFGIMLTTLGLVVDIRHSRKAQT